MRPMRKLFVHLFSYLGVQNIESHLFIEFGHPERNVVGVCGGFRPRDESSEREINIHDVKINESFYLFEKEIIVI